MFVAINSHARSQKTLCIINDNKSAANFCNFANIFSRVNMNSGVITNSSL